MESLIVGLLLFLISISLDTRVKLAKIEVRVDKIEKKFNHFIDCSSSGGDCDGSSS